MEEEMGTRTGTPSQDSDGVRYEITKHPLH